MVDPGYHLWWYTRSTHSSDGTSPGSSEGKINPGLRAQPQHLGIFGNRPDAHAHPDIVEKHVAGVHDGVVQIDHSVAAFPVHPAFVHLPIKNAIPRAKCREIFRRHLGFQHRCGHDDLEYRSGRQLRLGHAVQAAACPDPRSTFAILPSILVSQNHSGPAPDGSQKPALHRSADPVRQPRPFCLPVPLLPPAADRSQSSVGSVFPESLPADKVPHLLADAVHDHAPHPVRAH